MSRNNAPMRTQKPARGMAAVICGDVLAAAGGGAGGADPKGGGPDANGSAAGFGAAAAPAARASPAVMPGPAIAAVLPGGGLLRLPGVAPANAGGGLPPARRARTRSTNV